MSADDLRALADRLPSRVFRPGSDPYKRATTPRNASAKQQPAVVVTARSAGDVAAAVQAAAAADELAVCRGRHVQPQFIGISSALRQVVPDPGGANDDLEQVTFTGQQFRQ